MRRTLGPKWVEEVCVAGVLLAQVLGPKVEVHAVLAQVFAGRLAYLLKLKSGAGGPCLRRTLGPEWVEQVER